MASVAADRSSQLKLRDAVRQTLIVCHREDVARLLLRYFDEDVGPDRLATYFNFEAHLQWWAMGQGAEAYMPMRHYGEHGGVPNPEHAKLGGIKRPAHRADNLAAPLAFLPPYAKGRRLKLLAERCSGRMYGLARLFTGKWISDTNVYPRDLHQTAKMYWVGLRRLVS